MGRQECASHHAPSTSSCCGPRSDSGWPSAWNVGCVSRTPLRPSSMARSPSMSMSMSPSRAHLSPSPPATLCEECGEAVGQVASSEVWAFFHSQVEVVFGTLQGEAVFVHRCLPRILQVFADHQSNVNLVFSCCASRDFSLLGRDHEG